MRTLADHRGAAQRLVLAVTALVLTLSSSGPFAQGSLTFVRPPAQGPGTPGYGVIFDPTISAALSDGVSMDIGLTALIDLEGNGRPDLVGCHGSGPPHPPYDKAPCRVMRSQPDGSMMDVTRQLFGDGTLPKVTHAREFVSGDFNRDGRQDIFIAAHGYDAPPWGGETNVLLLSNADGTYTDRSSTLPQAPDFSHSACAGDINGDGILDIYVGNQGGSPIGPYFLVGRGDGTFTQKITGLPPSMSAGIFDTSVSLEIFMSCLFADIDQDGAPDLVLGIAPNDHVDSIVLFNDGTGDFTTRPRLVIPRGPFPAGDFLVIDIASLDINRDGRPDLILLQAASHAASGFALQVLITQSDGTLVDESSRLGPSTARLTGPWFPFLRLADFNGDGWEDLYLDQVYQDDGTSYPRIWLSSGNGTWSPVSPSDLPAEFSVRGKLHAADFDGDGRPDILRMAGAAGVNSPALAYNTYLNRTPRTVPSAPLIRNAVAGNARASIAFAVPLAAGTSAINGYTATCNPGQVAASGTSSPITVTGLTNGRHYLCSVTATNSLGVSMASDPVAVTPLPPLDLNGDGSSDAFVYKSTTGSWGRETSLAGGGFSGINSGWAPGWTIEPAQFNNDALTDFFVFSATTGQWFKMLNDGAGGFTTQSTGGWWPGWQRKVMDLDGDGLSDLFLYDPVSGQWYKCLATPTGFTYFAGGWGPGWALYPWNLNGDARDDLFLINPTTGQWVWAQSESGGSFTYPVWGAWGPGWQIYPGDFSGDGRSDLLLFNPTLGQYYVATNTGAGFSYVFGTWSPGWTPYVVDLDGNGRADLFLYHSSGQWFQALSDGAGQFTFVGTGGWAPGWSLYPTDFNGDGRTDLLLYSPTTGVYFQAWNLTFGSFTYFSGGWDTGLTIIVGKPVR